MLCKLYLKLQVLGIEGIKTKEELQEVIKRGEKSLNIGNLSLMDMEKKLASGTWKLPDQKEACLVYTTPAKGAGAKPAFSRKKLNDLLLFDPHVISASNKEGPGDDVAGQPDQLVAFYANMDYLQAQLEPCTWLRCLMAMS